MAEGEQVQAEQGAEYAPGDLVTVYAPADKWKNGPNPTGQVVGVTWCVDTWCSPPRRYPVFRVQLDDPAQFPNPIELVAMHLEKRSATALAAGEYTGDNEYTVEPTADAWLGSIKAAQEAAGNGNHTDGQ